MDGSWIKGEKQYIDRDRIMGLPAGQRVLTTSVMVSQENHPRSSIVLLQRARVSSSHKVNSGDSTLDGGLVHEV